jgi:hypothetical protein
MNTYATSTTVEPQGDIRVVGVPFAPGKEVDVTISPKRRSAEEFIAAWQRVCDQLRALPQAVTLTDDANTAPADESPRGYQRAASGGAA